MGCRKGDDCIVYIIPCLLGDEIYKVPYQCNETVMSHHKVVGQQRQDIYGQGLMNSGNRVRWGRWGTGESGKGSLFRLHVSSSYVPPVGRKWCSSCSVSSVLFVAKGTDNDQMGGKASAWILLACYWFAAWWQHPAWLRITGQDSSLRKINNVHPTC